MKEKQQQNLSAMAIAADLYLEAHGKSLASAYVKKEERRNLNQQQNQEQQKQQEQINEGKERRDDKE